LPVAAALALSTLLAQTGPANCPTGAGLHEVIVCAVTTDTVGRIHHLRGSASVETSDAKITADRIDYNEETGDALARDGVHIKYVKKGEEIWADRVEYNIQRNTGIFFNVHGTSPAKIDHRPGILTTTNPFYFEGRWAERIKEKIVLYHGFVTDCRVPRPWWTLHAVRFDIIPEERALAYKAVFRLRFLPMFYSPVLYKSLEEQPRKSGFLTPNIGNSSRRGKMVGVGYFWAINRSYDASYRSQWFTQRGFAHTVDFRGKPSQNSGFDFYLYGVNDRGLQQPNGDRLKEGGLILDINGHADLGHGFYAQGVVNYLTSMRFRRAFTESFNEAIFSEVHSTGFVGKHWSDYGLSIAFARLENIQDTGAYDPVLKAYAPDSKIVIRKLPELDFVSRPRRLRRLKLPVWVSLESSAGLLRRNQPLFQTRQFVDRIDFQPRVMTALRWKGFNLLPSFSVRETTYGSHQEQGVLSGGNITRSAREFTLELLPPSFARTFDGPRWLGEKIKHVIEPRVFFRHAAGIEDFNKLILFDQTELMSNTTEVDFSVTNRLYAKRGGVVNEVFSWQLSQSRYFDPSFGGAVVAIDPATGQPGRNVVLSSLDLTGFAFLYGPRRYSPVISVLRANLPSGLGMEWRSDYDPLRRRPVNSVLQADWRHKIYSISLGHSYLRSGPQLSPSANQFRGMLMVGNDNRRGWNTAFSAIYDYRIGVMQFATTQVTYNTDCCGFSVQYRRFAIGTRNENQFRVAFSVANIGSFGTLKRQERLF
jgi:LPS-assembly protein